MKRCLLIAATIVMLIIAGIANEAAAQRYSVTGRVVDSHDNAIAYATVVLLKEQSQVSGGTTNSEGEFSLTAASGQYTLNIGYIGYRSVEQEVDLKSNIALGDIRLEEQSEKIEEVVVTAQLIRREADRFVVDIANSPIAIGKDGEELLKSSPGVWINDDTISINGTSGAKVYINDREVKMEDAQLIAYLRSLRAEDIQRIEVIPQSGADYDASSVGGIIKIVTKRRIDSGLMGTASFATSGTKGAYNVMPSVSLNYNRGKVNAYGRAWAGASGNEFKSTEHTDYTSGTMIDAASTMYSSTAWAGGNVGVVYDINDRHSVGGEVQYNYYGGNGPTSTWTNHTAENNTTRSEGKYRNIYHSRHITATLNYIYKLDDRGSTLKLIGDYTSSAAPNSNSYSDSTFDILTPHVARDSTYRDSSKSHYRLGTATIAMEKVLNDKVTLKAGVKYTHTENANSALYEYRKNDLWHTNTERGYNIGYNEDIGAAYLTASARLGRWSIVGGLRGEYTSFRDNRGEVTQEYFNLFPNANISYALSKDGAYSMVMQYSRTIARPSFWALSPNETKISEYMIQRGNPNLKASYDNSLSLTFVLKYKYTISLGMSIKQNAIQQSTIVDKDNPEMLIMQHINYPVLNGYYASASLPFQFTKWWSANINLTGIYLDQRLFEGEAMRHNFMGFANAQMSFTLPKSFFIELSGNYMHGIMAGNTRMSDMGNMHLTLKRRMLGDKLTISLGVQNIIPQKQRITIEEASFTRRMVIDQTWQRPAVKFSISYTFSSGKQFRAKAVESGSAEERSRISSGGGE